MSAATLIARKSVRARWGRTLAILFAITASVSFVVGSFVLADSLRATFNNLFQELNEEVDLEVRASQAFESDDARDPIDVAIADSIRTVDGVAIAEPILQRYAQLLDANGDAITPPGGPTFGVSWEGDDGLQGVTVKAGRAPTGSGELAIDKATADAEGFAVGDTVSYLTDAGTFEGTITGTVGLGSADSFGGAQLVALDLDTALVHFGADGKVDAIDISVDDGADVAAVQLAIEAILPPQTEVVTGEEVAQETADNVNQFINVFGTGLLIFAFVTAFVSAFIINNVFQITIGQRLRELALLRAVGASGRQVRWMISTEALVLGVLATVFGVIGGIGVANLLIFLFDAAGAGFPDTQTVLQLRTVIVAALVGIGITMASVIVPSRRAAKIPPVAAMRPELGFAAMRSRRLVAGAIVTVIGIVMFLVGLFLRPGGTPGLIAFAGIGALVLFLGVASLSSTVATPVTRVIGWPIEKLFKVPGSLARQNVARAPRRTSSSASALMIGVALVSGTAVFASSLRASLIDTLESAISADYIITDTGFQGLSPVVSETLAAVPELEAVTPIRGISGQVDGGRKDFGAVDPIAFDKLVDPDLQEGTVADLGLDELLLHKDPANDLDASIGSTVEVTFQNGVERTLTVAGIYGDATFGNWLIGLDTLAEISEAPSRDFFVIAKLGDGVDPVAGDAAVQAAMEPFPQANVQTNAEFLDSQEAQINQLLLVITLLLAFAILIAILGISITLALGVFERTREIGLLRAVGMNKRQTRRSVRWEAVIVSTFGALVGIVVGTFLGVILTLAVPDDVISKLAFNPTIIVAILVGAVIAGLAAAIYPSFKASNMNVLEAIATE
ncbi:MAG TPA: FtsX-like permease family protein [Ilumatobacteraceae bacterium]|nr:FtsX-like permease family protein [Ilumatobacteraceae bacterium]